MYLHKQYNRQFIKQGRGREGKIEARREREYENYERDNHILEIKIKRIIEGI